MPAANRDIAKSADVIILKQHFNRLDGQTY